MGAGTALKVAATGSAAGYVAWQTLVNDKSLVRTASDVLVGEAVTDKAVTAVDTLTDKVSEVTTKAGDTLDGVQQATTQMNTTMGGIGTFLRNLTGGNGLNMMGNLFSNIAGGNVPGMSILGLLLGGLLVFGRFGWLGKIAGALMSMMLIGNNSRQMAVAQTQTEGITQRGGMRR